MKIGYQAAYGVILSLTSLHARAITFGNPVPEPSALSLIGVGAVAGLAVWIKVRRGKK